MKNHLLYIFSALIVISCNNPSNKNSEISKTEVVSMEKFEDPSFTLAEANKLIELPLHCVATEYPYKPSEVLESEADLVEPIKVHPIFYGCFD